MVPNAMQQLGLQLVDWNGGRQTPVGKTQAENQMLLKHFVL